MTYDKTFPVNAQFIDTFYPTIDGVVRTVDNYARIMNKYSYSCVVTPGAAGEYADDFPYDVVRAKSVTMPLREYRLAVPGITDGLESFLDSRPFQLFHAHSPFTMGRYALRQARRLGIPIVASFHSKYYDDIMDLFHSPLVAEAAVKEIVKFYENVDAVWACSEGTADTLRDYGYRGGITVMDNGTDYSYPDLPEVLKTAAAEKFDIPNGRTVLLFVGHQVWQKNIRMVLDTAAELRDRGFVFTLLMSPLFSSSSAPVSPSSDRLSCVEAVLNTIRSGISDFILSVITLEVRFWVAAMTCMPEARPIWVSRQRFSSVLLGSSLISASSSSINITILGRVIS